MKCLVFFVLFVSSGLCNADNIGFGTIKGIKLGNDNADMVQVYLNVGYTNSAFGCNGEINIHKSQIGESRYNHFYAAVLAAYMAQTKVRFFSHSDNCNATFLALQDSVY